MTVRETFPEGALTLQQWQRLQDFSRTLSREQARWVSGYFAGFDAGLLQAAEGRHSPGPAGQTLGRSQSRTLTVLYGSETGNSAEVARSLADLAGEHGRTAQLFGMDSYKVRRLKDEQDLLIVVSTHGEGDPPQPALGFFEFVEGRKAARLDDVRFAVLALGDSSYEKYCEAGKRLDRRFEELGATRIQERVDCDIDFEQPAAAWSALIVERLASEAQDIAVALPATAASATATPAAYGKRNPFAATVIENILIVGRGSSKETRHLEFDISAGLAYEPGDSLGIAVRNDPATVDALLDAVELPGAIPLSLNGASVPLAEALAEHFEIAISTPRFIDHWAKLSGAPALKELLGDDQASERRAYLHGHHVVDIVRSYPVKGIDAETLVAGLRPLAPRLFSIASSLAATPGEAHITLAPVRYELHSERRSGVASAHLADRAEPGSMLPVYVQPNPHFRLPNDDVPIIMIGAGTGIAPYRSFLQEQEARGAGGRSWLFLGERNFKSDFLYQVEWQEFLKQGLLTRMDVAFSRDRAGKVYVQDRMLERSAEIFAWLEEGAHLYVCGDAANMAPDVHETLIEIVAKEGQLEREAAAEYVHTLQADQRYQRDVY